MATPYPLLIMITTIDKVILLLRIVLSGVGLGTHRFHLCLEMQRVEKSIVTGKLTRK